MKSFLGCLIPPTREGKKARLKSIGFEIMAFGAWVFIWFQIVGTGTNYDFWSTYASACIHAGGLMLGIKMVKHPHLAGGDNSVLESEKNKHKKGERFMHDIREVFSVYVFFMLPVILPALWLAAKSVWAYLSLFF